MKARGLKQEDLSAIVAQSNLSAILAGKRKISATLAGKLGKFFGISAAVLVPVQATILTICRVQPAAGDVPGLGCHAVAAAHQ